MILQVYSDAYR